MLLKLPGLTKRNLSKIKFKGMALQLYCSLLHGNINWRNRTFLTQKATTLAQYGLNYIFSR
jgi:hypothetical protein